MWAARSALSVGDIMLTSTVQAGGSVAVFNRASPLANEEALVWRGTQNIAFSTREGY